MNKLGTSDKDETLWGFKETKGDVLEVLFLWKAFEVNQKWSCGWDIIKRV
jgi:hypothetical protein